MSTRAEQLVWQVCDRVAEPLGMSGRELMAGRYGDDLVQSHRHVAAAICSLLRSVTYRQAAEILERPRPSFFDDPRSRMPRVLRSERMRRLFLEVSRELGGELGSAPAEWLAPTVDSSLTVVSARPGPPKAVLNTETELQIERLCDLVAEAVGLSGASLMASQGRALRPYRRLAGGLCTLFGAAENRLAAKLGRSAYWASRARIFMPDLLRDANLRALAVRVADQMELVLPPEWLQPAVNVKQRLREAGVASHSDDLVPEYAERIAAVYDTMAQLARKPVSELRLQRSSGWSKAPRLVALRRATAALAVVAAMRSPQTPLEEADRWLGAVRAVGLAKGSEVSTVWSAFRAMPDILADPASGRLIDQLRQAREALDLTLPPAWSSLLPDEH